MAAKKIKNQKGFAILEAVVFLTAFMVLAVYAIDFFSAIHTGVVGSIGARAYLFETLRHRADINYMRTENNDPENPKFANAAAGFERFHAVNDEDFPLSSNNNLPAVGRILTHNEDDPSEGNLGVKSIKDKDNPVTRIYVKSGYGICTDSRCLKDGG